MDLTGTIIAVLPAQSGVSARTGNPWMSQEYVIEVPGMYPKRMCFRIFGEDRIKQLTAPFPPASAAPPQGNDDLPF